jgi:lipoyl(octanoyl) transferase
MLFWSLRTDHAETVPYDEVRGLQHRLVDFRAQDLIEDLVLFLEHDPVVTRGRGLQYSSTSKNSVRHMPISALPPGVAFAETERGGDLTYHGPGQLVIYPICKMDGKSFAPVHDVAAFLRKNEQLVITVLDRLLETSTISPQAKTEPVEEATGVWIRAQGETKASKKIASIGIAVKKWVSYHGLALNVVNDLRAYQLISPCGFSPEVMTRLQDWVALPQDWRGELEKAFAEQFAIEAMDGEVARVEKFSLTEVQKRLDQIESDARSVVTS